MDRQPVLQQQQLAEDTDGVLSVENPVHSNLDETSQTTTTNLSRTASSGQEQPQAPAVVANDDDEDEDNVLVTDNDCKNEEEEEEEDEDDFDGPSDYYGDGMDENDDEEDEYEYTYEDDDETHYAGFLKPSDPVVIVQQQQEADKEEEAGDSSSAVTISQSSGQTKSKWKEPSRAAVSMSLRAERETSGGKRRLAQDLYKIMMGDTSEQGFKLEPASEDSMDKWKILLFDFDQDSNLAKDLKLIGMDGVELEMSFPDQYPFQPPFVRVTKPKFKKQTGFVMGGALCMELLTTDGWNPINDIESVIVSIRSLLVVGDGRLEAAEALRAAQRSSKKRSPGKSIDNNLKRKKDDESQRNDIDDEETKNIARQLSQSQIGGYTVTEARQAYTHLSDYHRKKGWDQSGWWSKKG